MTKTRTSDSGLKDGGTILPGHAGVGTALEDDAEKLYISAFPCAARRPSVSYGATVNLTRLREITQDLADLFGLRLPISLKK